jgi:hypothetical protein
VPAPLNPTLAFASFITHAQILMPTMHAEILPLKNVLEIITQGMATTLTLQGSSLPHGAFSPNLPTEL